jgi:hypothetical protein
MRKFHSFLNREEPGIQYVTGQNLGRFDHTVFWQGRRMNEPLPASVKLWLSKGTPCDYPINQLSWEICSDKLTELLLRMAKKDVQVFEAPTYLRATRKRVKGFKILNYIRLLDCLDHKRSDIVWREKEDGSKSIDRIREWVLKSRSVPPNVHLFRCLEYHHGCFISDELAQSLVGKGLRGLAFERMESS